MAQFFIIFLTFLKPISLAYSWKHWRQMFKPYFLMIPCPLEQARLEKKIKIFLLIFFEVMENVLAIFTAFHLIFLPYSILHLPMAWSWSIISWMSVPNASETHDYLIFCDFSSSQIEVSAKKKVFIPHMRSRPWQSLWSVDFFQIFRQRFFHMWFF